MYLVLPFCFKMLASITPDRSILMNPSYKLAAQRTLNQGPNVGNKKTQPIDKNTVFPYLCHPLTRELNFY